MSAQTRTRGSNNTSVGLANQKELSKKNRLLGDVNTGPAVWVLAFTVFAAVVGASLGLQNVISDSSWLPRGIVVIFFTLLPAALLRRYSRLYHFAPLGALFGWVAGVTITFFPSTAYLSFIPSAETARGAKELAGEVAKTIYVSNTPVSVDLGIAFAICVGLGFVAFMVDTLAITSSLPAWSGLALVLLLLPAVFTAQESVGTAGFIGAFAGYLLILGCCTWYAPNGRLRQGANRAPSGILIRGLSLGAILILVVAFLPGLVPGFNSGSLPQGSRFGLGGIGALDPMISLGNDLRSPSSKVNLEYSTTSQKSLYLKMSTLEDFSGTTWKPAAKNTVLGLGEINAQIGVGDVQQTGPALTTAIDSSNLESEWLPAPLGISALSGLQGEWTWNGATGTIRSNGTASTLRQKYTVESYPLSLSAQTLRQAMAPPGGDVAPIFRELPSDVPNIVKETQIRVTQGAQNPYDKAMAIQNYLRSPQFSYSTKTPVEKGYDGAGMSVLAKFLESKSGYCVHFSAAMAVMARQAGIPSRIAVGYAPGSAVEESGADTSLTTASGDVQKAFSFNATGQNAHAWPELYFAGIGWVPFEPTLSRGDVPDYAAAPANSASATEAPADELNGADNNSPSAAAPVPAPQSANPSATSPAASASPGSVSRLGLQLLWIPAALLLVSIPALLRQIQRRQRLSQLRSTTPAKIGALLAWQELQETAADYGHAFISSDTPSEQATKLTRQLGEHAAGDIALILTAYQHHVFGPTLTPVPNISAEEPNQISSSLALVLALGRVFATFDATASHRQRILAGLLPASMFRARQTNQNQEKTP